MPEQKKKRKEGQKSDLNHGKRKSNSQGRCPSTLETNQPRRGPQYPSEEVISTKKSIMKKRMTYQHPGRRAAALVRVGKNARSKKQNSAVRFRR